MFMRNPPFLPTRFRPERVIKNPTPLENHGSRSIVEASSGVADYLIQVGAIAYHKKSNMEGWWIIHRKEQVTKTVVVDSPDGSQGSARVGALIK